ncbi:virulence promoting factor, partial [Klebsiella pneumoniae]
MKKKPVAQSERQHTLL